MRFALLLKKDFRNALSAFGPALLLGIPLLLIIQFTQSTEYFEQVSWKSAFWITFFFSSTSLYFRSFGLENRFKNFQLYTGFRISKLSVFLSQTLIHILTATILGVCYLGLTLLFWSPKEVNLLMMIALIALTSGALSPLGTVLGLMLQLEREFLFSVIYLPLATPVILGTYSLSTDPVSNWLYIVLSFLVGGGFLSAMIFNFFFDDLSQTT